MNAEKKLRNRLILAGVCTLIAAVCAFIVWFYYLRGSELKKQGYYLNDNYDTVTESLADGKDTQQSFSTDGCVYAVGVYFRKLSDTAAGTVHVTLTDSSTGECRMSVDGNIAQVIPDGYTSFALDTPVTTAETHNWVLTITPRYTESAGGLALAKSGSKADGMALLKENGVSASGSLALSVSDDVLGSSPVRAYVVLCVLACVLLFVLVMLCTGGKVSKAVLTFIAVFVIGCFYQFALPAYSSPDEALHYHTAYALSNSWLGISPTQEGCNYVERQCDIAPDFTDYNTDAFTYRYILSHLFDSAAGNDGLRESHVDLMEGCKLPYLLSAAGITFARLAGFGGVATAVFARLLNLLLFAVAASFAVKYIPFAKGLFAVFALLPSTLHLAGSYSYDSVLLSLSILFVALVLKACVQSDPVSKRHCIAMVALCILQAPIKSIYFPICLLILMIPAMQFGTRKTGLLVKGCGVGGAALHFAAYNWLTVYRILRYSVINSGKFNATHTAASSAAKAAAAVALKASSAGSAAATAAAVAAEQEVGTFSLFYLLAHPGILLKLLCSTFLENAGRYFSSVFGGSLGYLNLSEINISGILVGAFVLLMIAACVRGSEDLKLPALPQRLLMAAVFLLVFAEVIVICIYWTPADYSYLWGFQGRYLLPVLPCLMLALPLQKFKYEGDSFSLLLCSAVFAEVLTLLNVFAIVFQR